MSKRSGIFNFVRGQVKKVTSLGAKSVEKVSKEPVEKVEYAQHSVGNVIEGQAHQREWTDTDYQDIQQLFRHQFPSLTRQLIGKRFNTLNRISHFVLPNGMDQAADEILMYLDAFSANLAATEKVLDATGCKTIQELQKDVARSHRAGKALKERNKFNAALQGTVSGLTGLLGAAADLPSSMILSLKTIYEIGHAYGFELENEEDRYAIFEALSQVDLGLIAEKQKIFLLLHSLKLILTTGDYGQLQGFLNSNYSIEQFQGLITRQNGEYKWSGFSVLRKLSVFKYAPPLIGGAVGALYNIKLIDEVAEHADEIFSYARQYLLKHPDEHISILAAYDKEKAAQHNLVSVIESATQPQLEQKTEEVSTVQSPVVQPEQVMSQNNTTQAKKQSSKTVSTVVESKESTAKKPARSPRKTASSNKATTIKTTASKSKTTATTKATTTTKKAPAKPKTTPRAKPTVTKVDDQDSDKIS